MRAERKSRELCVCAHSRRFVTKRQERQNVHRRTEKTVIKIQLVSPHTHTQKQKQMSRPVCRSVSPSLCTHLWIYCLLKAGILNLFSAWSLWSHLSSSHSEPPQWIHGFMLSEWYFSPRFWRSRLHVVLSFLYYIILYRVGNPPQWMIRNKSLETYETDVCQYMWPLNPHETNIVFGTLQSIV